MTDEQSAAETGTPIDPDAIETREWLESLAEVFERRGGERMLDLVERLREFAHGKGFAPPFTANTPYVNTIPVEKQPPYPGDRELERRIKSLIRWNAMAMVVRANRAEQGIGGHISTYASAATLLEVGFNHFFRARTEDSSGDQVYFQGHSSPGMYARAFLEGRLTRSHLENFRRELQSEPGLSSYPHPWLMPDFWQFPTVSMGLGPITAIYQARFNHYLVDRGLMDVSDSKVWCFIGDGETDEPETLGAITLASREKLDNLLFVINCNLQRLDGPVRGNGKIIQELEAAFRGAGWNVVKVVWGHDWDALLARDETGALVRRMNEVVDGDYQKYTSADGDYIRDHFFGKYPELRELVAELSDEQLRKLRRGGHDPEKVFAAFKAATEHKGAPTVILAKTVKGYGLGEAGEGRNISHQQKKMNEDEMREFRTRFGIPISDEDVALAPFYRPPDDAPEMKYLRERREALGGYVPRRVVEAPPLEPVEDELFAEFHRGTEGREVSTTMAFVRLLSKLLKHEKIGKRIVPIVPDESRTFGMEALFRQVGIYSHVGQVYEPVDRDSLLYYKEATDGQILEEGITETGSMASFVAAGTAYATHGIHTIPCFIYYSMFGAQRVGDLFWLAADARAKGFLLGATAGRTTLNGEGLQHEDGHSHLLVYSIPNLMAYDPAYAYEVAVIVQDGIKRMYGDGEDLFYYITLQNENYAHPPMPEGAREGILEGLYLLRSSEKNDAKARVRLLGSGSILNEALKAAALLEENYGVAADVYSATSYKRLHDNALDTERWNLLHPEAEPRIPYITKVLSEGASGESAGAASVHVAVSDFVKALPDSVARWVPGTLISLGTDGFGRSESRAALRDFFEVDAKHVALAALTGLVREGTLDPSILPKALADLDIRPDKANPLIS